MTFVGLIAFIIIGAAVLNHLWISTAVAVAGVVAICVRRRRS